MKKLLFYAIAFLLVVALLEGSAIAFYLLKGGSYRSPTELYQNPNLILQVVDEQECTWGSTLVPHPYLAYIHIPGEACDDTKWNFNRQGFFGTEIPLQRDERYFDILLTGGSVAAFMGQMAKVGPNFLEAALNDKYLSPSGKPFRVLNAALGGWQQPHQLIQTALHGRAVSAVVTLEGFNELQRFFDEVPFRLSRPGWQAHDELVEPVMRNRSEPSPNAVLGFFRAKIQTLPILRSSTFVFALYDLLSLTLAARPEPPSSRQADYDASFAFPDAMKPEDRLRWNLNQYRSFLSSLDAIADRMGIPSVVFLQPAPRVDKPLTDQELARMSRRRYAEIYVRIVQDLLTLNDEGVSVVSLLDLYSGNTETIYADSIHPTFDWATGDSKGLRLMADRMAQELAAIWKLEEK